MGDARVRTHRLGHEALLALIVLAMAFLNFGHQSAVFAASGRVVITAHAICGDPGAIPSAGDHFSCHGCRPDAAVLPPEPCAIEPVRFIARGFAYQALIFDTLSAEPFQPGNPRAPPAM